MIMITSFFQFTVYSLQNVRGTWYVVPYYTLVTRNTPRNNIKCNFMPLRNTCTCVYAVGTWYMVPTKVQSASVCGTSVPVG